MADVSIALVREFFEESGFLVKINRKYIPIGRTRTQSAEIDLAVINPVRDKVSNGVNPKPESGKPESFIISPNDLKKIPRAIVKVKGWHTETFSPSVLNTFPKIFQFVAPNVVRHAQEFFGTQEFWKILVVPSLPRAKASLEKSIEILKTKGIDGVIEFKTILGTLANIVKPNRNYFESDMLQLIRLFKVYDMLKLGQMELFSRRRRRG